MAPRPPKKEDNPTSTSGTPIPEVLKPKTEKAKVEKAKSEPKTKVVKAKTEKAVKPKAVTEKKKVEKDGKDGKAKAGEEKEKKVKAVTGDEAVALIVEYLRSQNRPFSATEVSANLHGKVTKTLADKLLKDLGEKNVLGMAATNKKTDTKGTQFVFWTPQDASDAATPEELKSMDDEITSLKASNPSHTKALKTLSAKLSVLNSAPSTSELQTIVQDLQVQNAIKAEKLAGFKSGSVKMFSKEEMETVEKRFRYWGRAKMARKKAYEELEFMLLESGKTREDIREECGIEGDD